MTYYKDYQEVFGSVGSTPQSRYSVEELLLKLDQNISDSKKKNMEILSFASEVSGEVNALYV